MDLVIGILAVSGFPGMNNFRLIRDYVAAVGRHMHTPLTAKIFRPETLSFISIGAREILPRLNDDLEQASLLE